MILRHFNRDHLYTSALTQKLSPCWMTCIRSSRPLESLPPFVLERRTSSLTRLKHALCMCRPDVDKIWAERPTLGRAMQEGEDIHVR